MLVDVGGEGETRDSGITLGKVAVTKAGLTRSIDTTTFLFFLRIVKVLSERSTTRKGPS